MFVVKGGWHGTKSPRSQRRRIDDEPCLRRRQAHLPLPHGHRGGHFSNHRYYSNDSLGCDVLGENDARRSPQPFAKVRVLPVEVLFVVAGVLPRQVEQRLAGNPNVPE